MDDLHELGSFDVATFYIAKRANRIYSSVNCTEGGMRRLLLEANGKKTPSCQKLLRCLTSIYGTKEIYEKMVFISISF